MRLGTWIAVLGGTVAALAVTARSSANIGSLETVAHVDLQRYAGRWYEIARYPNWFERDCERDVTATYTPTGEGKIRVVNACRTADGKSKVSTGRAKVVDPTTNAKLKVTFFWPFYGNYWVIDLGKDYEYAVVGEPSREYLWILSRTPQMDEKTYEGILKRLPALGYDPGKLIKVAQ